MKEKIDLSSIDSWVEITNIVCVISIINGKKEVFVIGEVEIINMQLAESDSVFAYSECFDLCLSNKEGILCAINHRKIIINKNMIDFVTELDSETRVFMRKELAVLIPRINMDS